MKKIVPFKKDIIFKTAIAEITSISLEHTLHKEEDNLITGEFIVSGEYKMSDASIDTESFSFNLPFDINVDEKYSLDRVVVDIDDFYYEVENEKVLLVNIDVSLDKLEEIILPIKEEVKENLPEERKIEDIDMNEEIAFPIKTEDTTEEVIESGSEKIESLFDNIDDSKETYKTYRIYIIRDGDTLESVMEKYSVSKEELHLYNDISEIKLGDKLIVPYIKRA